jgi:transposase
MSQSYRTDLTNEQWELLQKLIPAAKHGGRPRKVDMRGIIIRVAMIRIMLRRLA